MKPSRLLLIAGGTGGHILPAIVFGTWLRGAHEGIEVRYLSGSRPLETEIYRSMGVEPRRISMTGSPLAAPKGKRISRWLDTARSFSETKRHIAETCSDLCVAFGGYVSAAALVVCKLQKIPFVAHEQNAAAGRITKLASRFGMPVMSGWSECAPLRAEKFRHTGIPIRTIQSMDREDALRRLRLDETNDGPFVAVATGSLGSGNVRETIHALSAMSRFKDWNFIVINPEMQATERAEKNLFFIPRTWDLSPIFSISDIFITRGGASTLSEISAAGIPAIVIPWRGASDDHQMKNARILSKTHNIAIWDETDERVEDLAEKLGRFGRRMPEIKSDFSKNMYNASVNVCEHFWNLITEL